MSSRVRKSIALATAVVLAFSMFGTKLTSKLYADENLPAANWGNISDYSYIALGDLEANSHTRGSVYVNGDVTANANGIDDHTGNDWYGKITQSYVNGSILKNNQDWRRNGTQWSANVMKDSYTGDLTAYWSNVGTSYGIVINDVKDIPSVDDNSALFGHEEGEEGNYIAPDQVYYYAGSDDITICRQVGVIIAPNADVYIQGGGFHATIVANNIFVDGNSENHSWKWSEVPTTEPSATPTEVPTATPTEEPTATPTEEPTATPTEEPTATPTEEPTATPTEKPAATPTEEPIATPTEEPTATPTEKPTATPTEEPTATPTEEPTATPTEEPTATPTEEPTATPTEEPTATPTEEPTATPTEEPTATPTEEPSATPTEEPTATPTEEPSATPTEPTVPGEDPTTTPTEEPTATPTEEPSTTPDEEPTTTPTEEPTNTPVPTVTTPTPTPIVAAGTRPVPSDDATDSIITTTTTTITTSSSSITTTSTSEITSTGESASYGLIMVALLAFLASGFVFAIRFTRKEN